MNDREAMLIEIRRIYPYWGKGKRRGASDKSDKQIQAVYLRLKKERLIK